jgi:uncharacterized protein (TIGR02271 family)
MKPKRNSSRKTQPIQEVPRQQPPPPATVAQGTTNANANMPLVTGSQEPPPQDHVVVQLRQEYLVPMKEWVESGAIVIRKGVESGSQTIPIEVLHEEVDVQRVPVNRMLAEGTTAAPAPWQDGETLVIPIVEEELVVTKRLVVREEMRITKRRVSARQEVTETVRRETLELEALGRAQVREQNAGGPYPEGSR